MDEDLYIERFKSEQIERKRARDKRFRESHNEERKAYNKKWRAEHPDYRKKYITLYINPSDVGDLIVMLNDYALNRGNTFTYILNRLKRKYPDIAERLSVL